ncbi:MAG: hypothetical protein RIQ89_216 [Bacteroidota bacterium]
MIKVFKFGGASVKNADAIKNVATIIGMHREQPLIIIVSAMGKTTNALEEVVTALLDNPLLLQEKLAVIKQFHLTIAQDLGFEKNHTIYGEIENVCTEIAWIDPADAYRGRAFIYDQIVCQGEILSTKIISAYLSKVGIQHHWLDARDFILTDTNYRDAKVDWERTQQKIKTHCLPLLNEVPLAITQGFIGATADNFSTTLGREGSDYSAAIFSYCLDAATMTVWKDVPGVLSADPKYFSDAIKLEQLSYHDAIELTYYGATVIHPKTIKPLENKAIPLWVKSFNAPQDKGTQIGNFSTTKPLVPSFIFKPNQMLISISAKDFAFIAEEHLSQLFNILANFRIKINLMQNSAISFSICIDHDADKTAMLITTLQKDFKILYNSQLQLITVRHYYPSTIEQLIKGRTIIIEQRSRHTAQLVVKEG